MSHHAHARIRLGLLALVALLLGCAPGFWGNDPDGPQAVVISSSWQCPTPSPEPTVVVGYQPTAVPLPSTTPDPLATLEPLYSTPVPTATPYVRRGSDYFMHQRVDVNGVLQLQVRDYQTAPGPTPDTVYQRVTVQLDNTSGTDLPLLLDLGQLRTLVRPDGRAVQGTWTHDAAAATALGLTPAADPDLTENPDGTLGGGYPPGTTSRTLVFVTPPGTAQAWGISFNDGGATQRADGTGDGQVWFILRTDSTCTQGPGGGASDGGSIPPAGTPSVGSGSWPVPLDAVITRGFGCHSYFTGTRGPCGGDTPWWHDGIDFARAAGTPLYATRPMTVLYAGRDASTLDCSGIAGSEAPHVGFGNYVKLEDDQGYVYWMGHVRRWLVTSGQAVAAGAQVAEMGSTGCSTGPHLHFRVRLNGIDRNPLEVIAR